MLTRRSHRNHGLIRPHHGLISHASRGLQVKLSWLEKLGRWEEALQAYEQEHARSRRMQDRR